jgi:class I lanthipeptide synthase
MVVLGGDGAVLSPEAVSFEVVERLIDRGKGIEKRGDRPAAHHALPGCALLAMRASQDRSEYADVAVAHVLAAVKELPVAVSSRNVGATRVLSTALIVQGMASDSRLDPVLDSGLTWLSRRVNRIAERHHAYRAGNGPRMRVADVDLIDGLAGSGRVLLRAVQDGHSSAVPALDAALTVLTELLASSDDHRPGWWSTQQDITAYVACDASGAALTGMAHGVAGPLALLSIAMNAGFTVSGQGQAVRAAADWLLTCRDPDTGGWPYSVSEVQSRTGTRPRRSMVVHRWCTGISGIAQALHLAGVALADPDLVGTAVDALVAVNHAAAEDWDISEPIVCCGSAGVLATVLAARGLTPDPRLDAAADVCAKAVLGQWRPEAPFGFRRQRSGDLSFPADQADLLYGVSGIALALLDYAHRAISPWSSLLLLQ